MTSLPDAGGFNEPGASVDRPYQDYFARLYHRVIDDERIGKFGLAAYVALARFADFEGGTCEVRRKRLAEVARLSVRSLDAGLEELVAARYLEIERVQNIDGSWAPSKYKLLDTALAQVAVSGGVVHTVHQGGSAQPAPPPAPGARGVAHSVHGGSAHGAHQEQETTNKRHLNEKPAELPLDGAVASTPDKQSFNRRAQALARGYVELVPLSRFPAVLGIVKKALAAGYADDMVLAALQRLAADGRSVTTETLRIELEGITPARAAAAAGRVQASDQRLAADMPALMELARREGRT